ncbi:helix-turn-helix domain-containing protein [Frankia sp. B2]|uniref:helix-turn-helix domain-containing protein n=1 Tax=Frankia sp. B2 TaxID=2541730 RepID=UPI001F0FF8E8|nr:helix-turn-helix domain-containing protein [Frankia sp. B2]
MPDDVIPARARGFAAEARAGRDHTRSEVSCRLMASWQRSEEYGVSLDDVDPVFSGTIDQSSLFYDSGREVLASLHRTLAAEPVSLMLTDADGLVLNRLSGDTSLLRALDRVHLAPGFSYAERVVGTTGLGLALADRAPSLVRAEEHYAVGLCCYTCAAAPVLHPGTGRLEGSVNLTTWSESSSNLLLALAESAAQHTTDLMRLRSGGVTGGRPRPRGEVFRVESPRAEPGAGSLHDLSGSWRRAVSLAEAGLRDGRVVACVGEPGSGRTTALAQALRRAFPRYRILAASNPAAADVEPWLSLWTPELTKASTAVIVRDVDLLPLWVAEQVRDRVLRARVEARSGAADPAGCLPFVITVERFEDIPAALRAIVDGIVPVAPLRQRPEDIGPLARVAALRARGREVDLTPAAERALSDHRWPGNVEQLMQVVKKLARRHDPIDVGHLPAEVLSHGRHRLTRLETFERDEIVRALNDPSLTMAEAAERVGLSRSTLYRRIAQYGIRVR